MNVFNSSWDEFVKYNFLEDAISRDEDDEEKYGKPLDLRTGEVIKLDAGEDYAPMPADIDACEAMMENYNKIIEKRTGRIFECITK